MLYALNTFSSTICLYIRYYSFIEILCRRFNRVDIFNYIEQTLANKNYCDRNAILILLTGLELHLGYKENE